MLTCAIFSVASYLRHLFNKKMRFKKKKSQHFTARNASYIKLSRWKKREKRKEGNSTPWVKFNFKNK